MDKDKWIVVVEKSLEGEPRPDKSHDGLIYRVPKSLLSTSTEVFYLPQVISLGPYHFERKHPLDDDIELLKSDVARKMHLKICNSKKQKENGGLISVVENFKQKQERIKESYVKDIKLSSDECAWMIVRDACFVIEVLERFLQDKDPEKSPLRPRMDSILSRKRHHPLLTEIVKDMLKMENQLTLWVLEEIRSDIVGSSLEDNWFELALKNLSPIEVAKEGNRKYNKESHILQLLHDYIVDRQESVPSDIETAFLSEYSIFFIRIIFSRLISIIISSAVEGRRFLSRCLFGGEAGIKRLFRAVVYALCLLLLSPVFVIFFGWGIICAIWDDIQNYIYPKEKEKASHVPTVEELKMVGVKFKRLEGGKGTGIDHIQFKKSNSTLYLPKFKVDNRSEVILRNLIALEICSEEVVKPITRYALLMNDLINTSADVGILRRADIITNKLGSDDEAAQLWNSIIVATEMPRYDPIDTASSTINAYRKKWWKVLWAQFMMVHCSKPWLLLSLLGGIMLLLLTLAQVVCLFEPCQAIHT